MATDQHFLNIYFTKLLNAIGRGAPATASDIFAIWEDFAPREATPVLIKLIDEHMIVRYDNEIFYIPVILPTGEREPLSSLKALIRKYLKSSDDVFGFFCGLTQAYVLGLVEERPELFEIRSTRQTIRRRLLNVGDIRCMIFRAKSDITPTTLPIYQIIEVVKVMPLPLSQEQIDKLIALNENKPLNRADVLRVSHDYRHGVFDLLLTAGIPITEA
ncbi:MAG: hypothetical protein LBE09_04745 [Christensenellaceae bacterium]|jgi:hypothetical protein|nr:hypothetical protein [Christensenellaceae bacterium]